MLANPIVYKIRTDEACTSSHKQATHSANLEGTSAVRSVLQRQGYAPAIASGLINCDEDFQRMKSLAAVGVRHRLPTKRLDHVVVVERMPEAIHGGRVVACLLDLVVIGI